MASINIDLTKFHTCELEQMRDQIDACLKHRSGEDDTDPHGVRSRPPRDAYECLKKAKDLVSLFGNVVKCEAPADELMTWTHAPVRSRVEWLIKVTLEHIAAIPDKYAFDRKGLAQTMAYLLSQVLIVDGKRH